MRAWEVLPLLFVRLVDDGAAWARYRSRGYAGSDRCGTGAFCGPEDEGLPFLSGFCLERIVVGRVFATTHDRSDRRSAALTAITGIRSVGSLLETNLSRTRCAPAAVSDLMARNCASVQSLAAQAYDPLLWVSVIPLWRFGVLPRRFRCGG